MKKLFQILLLVFLSGKGVSQTTYVNHGTATSYNFQAGDSLYIASGTFTGSISSWVAGTKITVAPGAVFKPSSVNGYRSIYRVYGSAVLPNLGTAEGFELYNYGTTTFTGNAQTHSRSVYYNHPDANMHFKGGFSNWSDHTSFQNEGNVYVAGNLDLGGSGATLTNQGLLYVEGSFTLHSGTSFNNSCRLIAESGITFYGGSTIQNNGLIWSSSAKNNGAFTSHATISNSTNAIIKTRNFINYGHIRGDGSLYITGKSTLGSGASVGSADATEATRIYAGNRTEKSRMFDDQWGTVYPNAYLSPINEPDTSITPVAKGAGCSFYYTPYTILPMEWKGFNVALENNIPVLNWSVTGEELHFEVERSTDGKQFFTVAATDALQYRDQNAGFSTQLYYRVKAVNANGTYVYSAIKVVKRNEAAGVAVQAYPNPFAQQFNIRYSAPEKTTVTLRIYNQSAQVVYLAKLAAVKGGNLFSIEGAGNWKQGIYLVQVVAENGDMQSVRIMKQ